MYLFELELLQIKTVSGHHLTLVRLAIIKRSVADAREDVGKGTPPTLWLGCGPPVENGMEGSSEEQEQHERCYRWKGVGRRQFTLGKKAG